MTGLRLLREGDLAIEPVLTTERREFGQIYRHRWPDVFRYALLLVRHHHDAEDVAAEAFRRALEAWDLGRGPEGEPLPWLLLITRRIAIDRLRRRRLIGWLELDRSPEPRYESQDAAFRRSETWLWFEQQSIVLPAEQREAFVLRFGFDLADADAASVMGTTVGNVRARVSRGLTKLWERSEVMAR